MGKNHASQYANFGSLQIKIDIFSYYLFWLKIFEYYIEYNANQY